MTVVFDKVKHSYTNSQTGERYVSVSQLLSKYKKPFETDFFAEKKAKALGTTKDKVLEMWDAGRQQACDRGVDYHSLLENYINGVEIKEFDDLQNIIGTFTQHFTKSDFKSIYCERMLFNHDYKIAGTSDLVCDVKKDYFDIYDYKTNKKFNLFSKYSKYLLSPIDHLQECEYNTYNLQLSLYAYMYEKETGRRVRRLGIFYFPHEGGLQFFHMPYMKIEALLLLKHYNNGQTDR